MKRDRRRTKDASEDEFSTEHDSDGETLNGDSDLDFTSPRPIFLSVPK